MNEPSLDMAPQSGALTDERAAVIRSTGRGGGARCGRDNFQRFGRLRGRFLSPRRERPCFGAAGERREQPAQGGHGCSHRGVVTDDTRRRAARDARCSELARNAVGTSSGSGIKGCQIREGGRNVEISAETQTDAELRLISGALI